MFEYRYKGRSLKLLLLMKNCEVERLAGEMAKCGNEVERNC